MKIQSRAPMRISFGGGGTELSPYVETYGGCVLSAAIGIYAHVQISFESNINGIMVQSQETGDSITIEELNSLDLTQCPTSLKLASACLKYFSSVLSYEIPKGLVLVSGSEAPIGSGLGASSVLTVSIVNALQTLFSIHMHKNQIAETAHTIEREVLGLSGGLQDHYPAVYGGLNFIEFSKSRKASIQPLDLTNSELSFLESSLLLVYCGKSRDSAKIIEAQTSDLAKANSSTVGYFHEIKDIAHKMRVSISKLDLNELGKLLDTSWNLKKSTNSEITNSLIDSLYDTVKNEGAYGGKMSGAGGGGFLMFIVPPEKKIHISQKISGKDSVVFPSNIISYGAQVLRVRKEI
jgi:D-glycero-alpha-D-manno-heptose-7-phosphate kinase